MDKNEVEGEIKDNKCRLPVRDGITLSKYKRPLTSYADLSPTREHSSPQYEFTRTSQTSCKRSKYSGRRRPSPYKVPLTSQHRYMYDQSTYNDPYFPHTSYLPPYPGCRGQSSFEVPETYYSKCHWSPQEERWGQHSYDVPYTSQNRSPIAYPEPFETRRAWLTKIGYMAPPAHEVPHTSQSRSEWLPYRDCWGQPAYILSRTTIQDEIEELPTYVNRCKYTSCGCSCLDLPEKCQDKDRGVNVVKTEPKCSPLKKCISFIDLTLEDSDDDSEIIDIVSDSSDSSDSSSSSSTPTKNLSPLCTTPEQCMSPVHTSTPTSTSPVHPSTHTCKLNSSHSYNCLPLKGDNCHLARRNSYTRNNNIGTSVDSKESVTEGVVSCSKNKLADRGMKSDSERLDRKKESVHCNARWSNGQKGCQLSDHRHQHSDRSSTSFSKTRFQNGLSGDLEKLSINGNRHIVKRDTVPDERNVSHATGKFSDDVSRTCRATANDQKSNHQLNDEKTCSNNRKRKHSDQPSYSGPSKKICFSQDNASKYSVPTPERKWISERKQNDHTTTPISGNSKNNSSLLESYDRKTHDDNSVKTPTSGNQKKKSLNSFFDWIQSRTLGKHSQTRASNQLRSLSVATETNDAIEQRKKAEADTNYLRLLSKAFTSHGCPSKVKVVTSNTKNKTPNRNQCKGVLKTAYYSSGKKKKNRPTIHTNYVYMAGYKLPLLNAVGPLSTLCSSTRNKEPENLDQMQHIIFLDLDNWGCFFKFLPNPLPEKTFVWVFFGGGLKNWKVPTNDVFLRLKETGCLHFHEQCGSKSNAADFAIAVTVGKMDERLPKTIPFTILSGDRDFAEVKNQMRSSYRHIAIIDPHKAYEKSSVLLYALLKSVSHG